VHRASDRAWQEQPNSTPFYDVAPHRRSKSCHSDQHLAKIDPPSGTDCGTVSPDARAQRSSEFTGPHSGGTRPALATFAVRLVASQEALYDRVRRWGGARTIRWRRTRRSASPPPAPCLGWTEHQTTNLGVRSSNLFGIAATSTTRLDRRGLHADRIDSVPKGSAAVGPRLHRAFSG
jgi:hypothetical protein